MYSAVREAAGNVRRAVERRLSLLFQKISKAYTEERTQYRYPDNSQQ
jgi:hypothetical protein